MLDAIWNKLVCFGVIRPQDMGLNHVPASIQSMNNHNVNNLSNLSTEFNLQSSYTDFCKILNPKINESVIPSYKALVMYLRPISLDQTLWKTSAWLWPWTFLMSQGITSEAPTTNLAPNDPNRLLNLTLNSADNPLNDLWSSTLKHTGAWALSTRCLWDWTLGTNEVLHLCCAWTLRLDLLSLWRFTTHCLTDSFTVDIYLMTPRLTN